MGQASLTGGGLEKRSISLTPEQWAWIERQSLIDQSRSQSAVIRRLVEAARMDPAIAKSEALAA